MSGTGFRNRANDRLMETRKKTRKIYVGPVAVGGRAPISVQSMTTTDTGDVRATLSQIRRLVRAGCEIVRLAVPDQRAALVLPEIVRRAPIPVVADVHFNYRLALASIDAGAQGIRINPGNIGKRQRLVAVVGRAKERGAAMRIGINAGSLERDLLKKYGHPTDEALVESALRNIELVESLGFDQIKISIKSADVRTTIAAYRRLSRMTRYPLHIGVTEAGTLFSGAIKSAVGLGVLLAEGIGDTLRVSLSADPVHEVRAGFEILKSLGLRQHGPVLISCPTCARRRIDVLGLAAKVERRLIDIPAPITVAVMGCEVNGPGEAREADVGVAGSQSGGIIFRKGTIVKRCHHSELLTELLKEIRSFI